MRIGFLSSAMALLTGMSTALGQTPATTPSDSSPRMAQAQPDSAAPNAPRPPAPPVPPPPPEAGVPIGDEGGVAGPPGSDFVSIARRDNRFYGSAEYLLWKLRDAPLPPLQLTLPLTQSGLDNVQSSVVLPSVGIEYAGRTGGRLTLGTWCDTEHNLGIEGTYFGFEHRQDAYSTNQVANLDVVVNVIQNITTITVINGVAQTTITQTPIDIHLPGQLIVTTAGRAGPLDFWGAELNARSYRGQFGGMLWDFFAGFRFVDLDERFTLSESITLTTANPNLITTNGPAVTGPGGNLPTIPPALTGITNIFSTNSGNTITTRNHFYGAQVGGSFEWWLAPRVLFAGWGKLAMGAMTQSIDLNSITVTSSGSGVTVAPGGVLGPLVGQLNQGHTRYAVIPEFALNFGFQWTQAIRTTLGYNFMYLSTVARPGDQIGFSSSNTAFQIAGSPSTSSAVQPTFLYRDTDFWAQGLTAGLEFRW